MLGESPKGSQVEEEETGCEGSCITCRSGALVMHESAEAHTQFSVARCLTCYRTGGMAYLTKVSYAFGSACMYGAMICACFLR